jgi:hypothetical protein
MFDNPIFQYAQVRGTGGVEPTILSLANTTGVDKEVNLFNAENNLTEDNNGLPDGVVSNAQDIYEMSTSQLFSCYQTAPLNGFRDETNFSLETGPPTVVRRSFQLNTDVITNTVKTLTRGYNRIEDLNFYRIDTGALPVQATATGAGNNLRFVFAVTDNSFLKGDDITAITVNNSTTFPCTDRFPLIKTSTGFNNSGSSNTSTYTEILQSSNFAPYGVDSLVIQSPKLSALASNPIFVTERDANGNREEQQATLLRSPYMRPNQRVISNIRKIDGATEVRMTIPKNTTATLFIYDKNRIRV